jgi:bifunctional ADP-heptose synthase (sugar kinase/adenylyltransferase)
MERRLRPADLPRLRVAGALVVQKPGTATLTRPELTAELLRP